MNRALLLSVSIALIAWASAIQAGAPCCGGCGCQPCTKKVCRLVCEMKEESKNVYSCECEDFCLPGRSTCCKAPCDCPGKCCKDHTIWKPTCGCVKTRTVLVITKEKKKKPVYKCVVEEVCTRCGHCAKKCNYPESNSAAEAIAMVKESGIQEIIGAETASPSSRPTEPAASVVPVSHVTSRNPFERLFTRE